MSSLILLKWIKNQDESYVCRILLNSSLEVYQGLRILPNFHIISKNFTKMFEKFVLELVCILYIHYTILESGWCRFGQKWKLIKKESWRQKNWLDEKNPQQMQFFRVFRFSIFILYMNSYKVHGERTNLILDHFL